MRVLVLVLCVRRYPFGSAPASPNMPTGEGVGAVTTAAGGGTSAQQGAQGGGLGAGGYSAGNSGGPALGAGGGVKGGPVAGAGGPVGIFRAPDKFGGVSHWSVYGTPPPSGVHPGVVRTTRFARRGSKPDSKTSLNRVLRCFEPRLLEFENFFEPGFQPNSKYCRATSNDIHS